MDEFLQDENKMSSEELESILQAMLPDSPSFPREETEVIFHEG